MSSGFTATEPDHRGPDVPWWLLDARPSGFFGRAWLSSHADHGYPSDLARWTGEDVLRFAVEHGSDLVGALVVGPLARDRRDEHPPPLDEDRVVDALPELAQRALDRTTSTSSPGGEQPKLTLRIRDGDEERVELVKFSPPLSTPGGRRWADLLVCEHLAHDAVRRLGVDSCQSSVVDAGERRFLRVVRFDRHGARGRSGLVSLDALDVDGVGSELHRASAVTSRLVREGRLSTDDHASVQRLEAFGHAIANTDMHLGNLSLRMHGTTLAGLAPVYDMLPMFFAPRHGGELPSPTWRPPDDTPTDVRPVADDWWGRVASDERISTTFRRLAATFG